MWLLERMLSGLAGRMGFRQDGSAGGGAAPASTAPTDSTADAGSEGVDPPDEGADATDNEPTDDTPVDETATGDTGEAEVEGDVVPDATPAPKPEKTVPLSALIKLRTEMEKKLAEVRTQLQTVLPPDKDPVDAFLDQLPANADPESDAGKEAMDLRALAPLMKKFRPHLFPKEKYFDKAIAAAAQGMDRLAFKIDQIIQAMPAEQLPPGIKALDKVDAHRKSVYEKSGGRELPSHKDAFDAILEQAETEAATAATKEQTTRADERQRTVSEIIQRRGASKATGPGSVRAVPRGAPTGKRTFEQLERAAGDFKLP